MTIRERLLQAHPRFILLWEDGGMILNADDKRRWARRMRMHAPRLEGVVKNRGIKNQ